MRHAYSTNIHNDEPSTSSNTSDNAERWLSLKRETSLSAAVLSTTSVEEGTLKKSPSRQSLLKRTFSMQFLSNFLQPKLEKELAEKIRLRYKDTSKFVIWPECPIPAEFNQGTISLKSVTAKGKALNYKHAGNHQAEVMRQNNLRWDLEIREKLREGKLDVSALRNPKGIRQGRAKFYYHTSPILPSTLPPIEEVRFRKTKTYAESLQVAQLDDVKTPLPRRVINRVRRSESSDDNESLIGLTASDQELEVEPHALQL